MRPHFCRDKKIVQIEIKSDTYAKKTEFFLISFEEFEKWVTELDDGKSKPKQSFQISFEFINYKLTRSSNISLKTGAATSPPE